MTSRGLAETAAPVSPISVFPVKVTVSAMMIDDVASSDDPPMPGPAVRGRTSVALHDDGSPETSPEMSPVMSREQV